MAQLQKYFINFHESIKLRRFDENETLREKRDIIIDRLKARLAEVTDCKLLDLFNQGSYEMGTGVIPLDGDYDIDVGLPFDVEIDEYTDPTIVKAWVAETLDGHTSTPVKMKEPCVTVQYVEKGEPLFHVDLAVYAHNGNPDGSIFLARGKANSSSENKRWEISDPQGLTKAVGDRFSDEDAKQFRRVIRYLKRWKDFRFDKEGNSSPVGIGVTMAAYWWFIPHKHLVDPLQGKYNYNDLQALRYLTQQMLDNFSGAWHDGEFADRLSAKLPVQPYDDPFMRMTNKQMAAFKEQLNTLSEKLAWAENEEVDPVEACDEL